MQSTSRKISGFLAKHSWKAQVGGLLCLFAALSMAAQTQSTVPRPPDANKPVAPGAVPRPPGAQQAPPADDSGTTFRVNVKLVNVFATVTNSGGAPVSSLKQDDFQIYEDGKPQKIAVFQRESELPLSIVIAIDASLSTRNNQKLELDSARRFAHAILRPIDGISLFKFSEVVDQLTPFTDGGDTVSKTSYQDAVREAQQAEVILYSIIIVPIESSAGRDIGGEHALIQLSRDTGGKYFYASSMEQLDSAFRQI